MTVSASADLLRSSADAWDGWAEACADGRRGLARVSSAGFGPPGAALDAFVDTWVDRSAALRDRAQRHADALRSTAAGFEAGDESAAADVNRLLPHGAPG